MVYRKQSTNEAPFLYNVKKMLESIDGSDNVRPLHVCIESSHPSSLGRPSDALLSFLLSRKLYGADVGNRTDVTYHFIPDRLSVPPLNGHVIAFGGPRSNVISRISMEYEAGLNRDARQYERFPGITFPLDYVHIHREDFDGRLLADMTTLDPVAQMLIAAYFSALRSNRDEAEQLKAWTLKFFSVNRHFQNRYDSDDPVRRLPSLSIEAVAPGSSGQPARKIADWVIYDHFVETILPNIFSENWEEDKLIIYHGLRDLGTFASALMLEDPEHVSGLKKRLRAINRLNAKLSKPDDQKPNRMMAGAHQIGWRVLRPLENLIGCDRLESIQDLMKNFTELRNDTGHDLWVQRHRNRNARANEKPPESPLIQGEPVAYDDVVALRKDVNSRHYAAKADDRENMDFKTGYKSPLKLDRINHEQILDAMSLARDEYFRRHDIYVLGCFEQKKTVYTQQTRAITLVHALSKAGKIRRGTKIGIVGGGVSGVSAAIAAASAGARVVLCEQEKSIFPVQRNCEHRWLHPYFYDWPSAHSSDHSTNLPLWALNWHADSAKNVLALLESRFRAFQILHNQAGDNKELTVYTNFTCRMILYDKTNKKHILCERALARRSALPVSRHGDEHKDPNEFVLTQRNISGPARGSFGTEGKPDKQQKLWVKWNEDWKLAASRLVQKVRAGELRGKPEGADRTGWIEDRTPGTDETEFSRDEIVDCDILIFATGFGEETPEQWVQDNNIDLPESMLLNSGYWIKDNIPPPGSDGRSKEKIMEELQNLLDENKEVIKSDDKLIDAAKEDFETSSRRKLYIVSGAGDGALIDILRLCIKRFSVAEWHRQLILRMGDCIQPDRSDVVWANRRDVLVFAYALRNLFNSDSFKLIEGESDRLQEIDRTMEGFNIDSFLDQLDIQLNNVEVYNVSKDVQPFWSQSSVANRLLVWCLYKKGRVRFVRGSLENPAQQGDVSILRRIAGKSRTLRPAGVVIRHGVGDQPLQFLNIQGLFIDFHKSPTDIASDGRRLVGLLKLSNRLHPETEKFYRHTIHQL